MSYTVTVDTSDLKRVAKGYRVGGKLLDVAIVRAMNRGGDAGMVRVRSELAEKTGISDKDSRRSKGITKELATVSRPTYRVKAKSSYTPLAYFRPQQTKEGVRAAPWNRETLFAGTFMIRMSTGYVGVFKRDRSAARDVVTTRDGRSIRARPMKELWGPSLAVEMMRNDIPDAFRSTAGEKTMARLPHEITFAMGKMMGKKR